MGRYVAQTTPLTLYTFTVTDAETGAPIQGAMCAITDRPERVRTKEGVGCTTGASGVCTVEPLFPPRYYSVYKAGYGTARGSVPGTSINVALGSIPVQYWVSILAGTGGSVDPSGAFQVAANEKILVKATPDPDYTLEYWLVNGVKSGNTNPLGVTITRDSFSVKAVFKKGVVPPPPPPPPDGGWPVTRQIQAFNNFLLKATLWDVAKKKTWPGPINVDLSVLLGGKIDYTVSYLQGTPLAENADIYFNGVKIVSERLNKGETKTGSYNLAEIFSQNTITIGIESMIGFSSQIRFDVWITLGYSQDPVIEPGGGIQWPKLEWWQWGLAGALGLGALYVVTAKPQPPPLIIIGGERRA